MSTGIFLTNGQWRTFPQGYQLGDNFYCPDHIVEQIDSYRGLEPFARMVPRDMVEDLLTAVAANRGIDYSDVYSYDSDVFPKAVTDSTDENHCATCNIDLREV